MSRACPLNYEPSGTDFLSPCLEEVNLMNKVVHDDIKFTEWVKKFLPQLFDEDFELNPGQVNTKQSKLDVPNLTRRLLTELTGSWFTWTASTSPGPGACTTSPIG